MQIIIALAVVLAGVFVVPVGSGVSAARADVLRSITAVSAGTGPYASLDVNDPHVGSAPLEYAEYFLFDGYAKKIMFAGGAHLKAEDIAECGAAGQVYPDIGFIGTGVPCHPVLHSVEVTYHQDTGNLKGRIIPPAPLVVIETVSGTGAYLTVGHIDHGALVQVVYYWHNGEHLTVHTGGALVNRITLETSSSRPLAAVERHRTTP